MLCSKLNHHSLSKSLFRAVFVELDLRNMNQWKWSGVCFIAEWGKGLGCRHIASGKCGTVEPIWHIMGLVRQSLVGILASCFVAIAISLPAYAADQNPQSTESVEASPQNSSQSPVPTTPSQATPSASGLPAMPPPQVLEDYWIDPDRPHIADSSINVPKGLWLQENGFQQSYPNRSSQTFDFPESLIRLGISNRTELRYNVPNFVTLSAIQLSPENVAFRQHFTGFESMQAGFKTRLGPIGPNNFNWPSIHSFLFRQDSVDRIAGAWITSSNFLFRKS
jgi:hypothetical protein